MFVAHELWGGGQGHVHYEVKTKILSGYQLKVLITDILQPVHIFSIVSPCLWHWNIHAYAQ